MDRIKFLFWGWFYWWVVKQPTVLYSIANIGLILWSNLGSHSLRSQPFSRINQIRLANKCYVELQLIRAILTYLLVRVLLLVKASCRGQVNYRFVISFLARAVPYASHCVTRTTRSKTEWHQDDTAAKLEVQVLPKTHKRRSKEMRPNLVWKKKEEMCRKREINKVYLKIPARDVLRNDSRL